LVASLGLISVRSARVAFLLVSPTPIWYASSVCLLFLKSFQDNSVLIIDTLLYIFISHQVLQASDEVLSCQQSSAVEVSPLFLDLQTRVFLVPLQAQIDDLP